MVTQFSDNEDINVKEKFEKLPYFEQPQQPSKHIEVPDGATHWSSSLARPFFKV